MQYNYVEFEHEDKKGLSIAKRNPLPIIRESIVLLGRAYEAEIVLQESPKCERVYSLCLMEEGETLCFYEDGRWVIELDPMDGEAFIAVSYFMNAYNKRIGPKGVIYDEQQWCKKRLRGDFACEPVLR